MRKLNIYQRKDGRFEGRMLRERRRDGKRQFQYFFGRTREEVEQKMSCSQSAFQPADCFININQLFSEWYQSMLHRVKESTISNYCMKATKHILPYFGNTQVSALSYADVNAFIQAKLKSGLSYNNHNHHDHYYHHNHTGDYHKHYNR